MASRTKKRKICVLTGTRAEYGLLKPVMAAVKKHSKLELKLIVTGMHLSKEFGYTINDIKKDKFKVDKKTVMNPEQDTGFSMAQAIGKGIIGISNALKEIKPDVLLVLGDRIESLAGVIAAAYMNIPIAHIHGGDSARAGLDESVRHSITKFAHIHFPVTKKSAERIRKLGEEPKNIFVVGAPGLDTILNVKLLSRKEVEKKFEIDTEKGYILLVQHSVSTQPDDAQRQIEETLNAIKQVGMQTIAIYPNSDAGGRKIIKKLKEFDKKRIIKAYASLPHKDYLSLMKYAKVMVGNSSSGIMESASFKLPVVNIGIRQDDRERANNVMDVDHKTKEVLKAIKKALSKNFQRKMKLCRSPYGNGMAGKKIAKRLAKIRLNKKLLQKKITY
ncbi:MAG: UDP-N-acetylglucosamine 2-epimerase (hydrolyzing) [Nanoarchaeota archaeon]|nr:UDP-N-acetylglucosamine 2-epimerase (hydrolyzing) [DPANN group archaeon]MBL7116675.1 UDP-N-acetylglucosamine 2-epimerase (hydrolyzing) [Nanoarchaeota archaeon]